MSAIGYIVSLILLAVTLIVLAFAFGLQEGGMSEKILNLFESKTDQFIKESEQEAYQGELVKLPQEHEEAILKLNETIYRMLRSSKKDCFANYATISASEEMYNGFPLLQEGGPSIIMSYDETARATNFRVYGGAGGEQLVTNLIFSIPKMKPCVIAGSPEVVENFYGKFIEKKQLMENYHNPFSQITIKYEVGKLTETPCPNGNVIRVNGGSNLNKKCNNFLDGGWIFTPDNEHICFFPTSHTFSSDTGLNNDAVSGKDSDSIRSRLQAGDLEEC